MASLCTLANVKDYLGITGTTDDALIGALILRIDAMIERYLDRKIAVVNDILELHDGNSGGPLILHNYPAIAITEVNHDEERLWAAGTVVPASDYFVDLDRGMIFRNGAVPWVKGVPKNHRVKYNAGYATIPADIVHGAVLMTARAFKEKDNILVISQSLKDGSITKELSVFKFASLLKELLPWKARKA